MNLGEKGPFPGEILLMIFGSLSVQDLVQALAVCRYWNALVRSDVLWKKFIPKWKGFTAPNKPSSYETVAEMWKSSVRIGNERWYPNPLPELVRYESRLRKAEYHQFYQRSSKTTLYTRLNPCYEFTTKGKDVDDVKMNSVCREIWERFQEGNEEEEFEEELSSHEDAMKLAKFLSRTHIMMRILHVFEPEWFLEGLGEDVAGRDVNEDGKLEVEGSDEEDDEVEEDNLGDVTQCTENGTIFGPFDDETAWNTKVNKRLPVHLYRHLKALFVDQSENFIDYYLNDVCFNENFLFTFSLLISDTAALFHKEMIDI